MPPFPPTHGLPSAATWHPATIVGLSICLTLLAFWPLDSLAAAIAVPAALVAVAAAVAASAGPAAAHRWRRWTVAAGLPVAVSLFLIHGLVFPEGRDVLVRLGPLAVTVEGLTFAAARAARWLAAASALALVGALCRPAMLATMIESASLPGGLGHALASALLLAPAAQRSAAQIREAQRARGLETDGSMWRRVRSIAPLVVPLAVAVIVDGQHRALALTSRGFSPGQPMSHLEPLPDSTFQRRFRRAGPAFVLLALVVAHVRDAAR